MSDHYDSINYEVFINGKELSQDRMECIQSLETTENCDGADTLTINILLRYNYAFVTRRIKYCNAFFSGLPLKLLQHVAANEKQK